MESPEYKRGDIVILRLRTRLDSLTSNKLEEKFLALLDKGEKKVIVDFSHLDYISSAGLRVLLMFSKGLRGANGKIVLSSMQDRVKEVFDIAGFSPIFTILHSEEEAIKWFQ